MKLHSSINYLNNLILLVFLHHSLLLFFLTPGNCIHSLDSPCGNTELTDYKGTINSPNYPLPYIDEIECEWKIQSPIKSILKITIVDLDIDESEPCQESHCCSQHWLSVPQEGGRGSRYLCGNNSTEKTITVSQPVTIIKYYSSKAKKVGRGFEITYTIDVQTCQSHELQCINGKCVSNDSFCNGIDDCGDGSDEKHCLHITHAPIKYEFAKRKTLEHSKHIVESSRICREESVPCPLSPNHCYYPETDTCNNVFDCPKGEDEVNCSDLCQKQIACSSGDGCYSPYQRCNSIRNCRDNSDETNCPAEPCVPLQFTCLNGACVSGSSLCDGDDDCGDLSDEENCPKSSFMTAAIMGLLACIFLFCIGLSCLYRVYTARLRASAAFVHQLEPESMDDDFMYREPPPAYSVAINDARVISYPTSEITERFFEPEQTPRPHRSRTSRRSRRSRHRSSGNPESTSTPRSRPRPSSTFTPSNSSIGQPPESRPQPKVNDCNKIQPTGSRSDFQGHIELCGFGFPENVVQSRTSGNVLPTSSAPNESPCSSPSLSPSRESVTSSTSLEDQEDLVRPCQS